MKATRKLSVLLTIIILLNCGLFSFAVEEQHIAPEEKVCTQTDIAQDFADDRVVILLQKFAYEKEYSIDSFEPLKLTRVQDLNDFSYLLTEEELKEKERKGKENPTPKSKSLVLYLESKGKEEVLNAVSILEKREDVRVFDS